jgi:hydrogenase maturation protein HypF
MTSVVAVAPVRHRIRVTGVVQGVGFRPFLHRLAHDLELTGQVRNQSDGVYVEVEGEAEAILRFEHRLVDEAPPLAAVHGVEVVEITTVGDRTFEICDSAEGGAGRTFVSPDVAVCDDCLAEMFDPANRRFRYPFVNCTNCGPRFTITIRLPYDRPNTTMAGFPMCAVCESEYLDPADRRSRAARSSRSRVSVVTTLRATQDRTGRSSCCVNGKEGSTNPSPSW